jgi:hypothetical protein
MLLQHQRRHDIPQNQAAHVELPGEEQQHGDVLNDAAEVLQGAAPRDEVPHIRQPEEDLRVLVQRHQQRRQQLCLEREQMHHRHVQDEEGMRQDEMLCDQEQQRIQHLLHQHQHLCQEMQQQNEQLHQAQQEEQHLHPQPRQATSSSA